ncbi:hypothetical protein BJV82DRAFT_613329 [Fennellomyces sp. T-0311]|nr:hypothetical protein BJV82DRAFT_613329 [Fennellomyces sp. T-0311]
MKNPFSKSPPPPSDTPVVNAWESSDIEQGNRVPDIAEKTEYPSQEGTPTIDHGSSKSPDPLTAAPSPVMHARSASIDVPPPPPVPASPDEKTEHHKPNKGRLLVRVWQLFAAIGAFGFQVGATPHSGQEIPFSRHGLLYYVYAICWFSFLWSLFNIYVYLTRRFGSAGKIKRPISIIMDTFLAALFGVGTFYEFAIYRCPPGYYDGWCNFFNTGLFFCVSLFLTYVIQTLWDIFGGMSCLRRK